MRKNLPPLHALRVFESAAQHLSFTMAAQELCVTKAAISHQIKQLEGFLGLKLFERRNNQLSLTVAGEHYLPRVREAFRLLQEATDRLVTPTVPALNVYVPRLFGTKWLIPRLYRFLKQHPAIRVEIHTDSSTQWERVDMALTTEPLTPSFFQSTVLTYSVVFPVCSPTLVTTLNQKQELASYTLLHDSAFASAWQMWFGMAQLNLDVNAQPGLSFSDASLLLQAAIDGQGIALGQALCVEYDLLAGRLVCPLGASISLRTCYYLLCNQQSPKQEAIKCFRDWLFEELVPFASTYKDMVEFA